MDNQKNEKVVSDNGIILEKLKKVQELKDAGIEPYGRKFEKINSAEEIGKYDETSDKVFKTAGRIVAFKMKLEEYSIM